MVARLGRTKQIAVLTGLTLALVVSGAVPKLGGPEVEARKSKKGQSAQNIHATEVQTFSNGGAIAVVNGATTQSPITVSGFVTQTADVDVTINGLSSTILQDLDLLLVGPEGQTALFMSDMGFNNAANNVTFTLDDAAPGHLSSHLPLTPGTFQPANFDENDTFQPPAPAVPSSGSALGVFNGTDPNGQWNLFVRDDESNGSTSSIAGGWSMRIVSANGVPSANPESFQARAGQPLIVPATGVLGNDSDPDGDTLTAILAGQPKQGTLSLDANGGFTYTPNKKAKGTDSFTYLAEDQDGLNALATVDFQIKKKKKKKGK